MSWILIVVLAVVALGVGVVVVQRSVWARQCKAGAAKIHAELSRMYAGEHEYTRVSPQDFEGLDQSGYAPVATALMEHGFRPLGTIEDLTVTAVYPHNRTYVATYVSADGIIGAGTYYVSGRQILDLVTSLDDGRSLVTTNAGEFDKLTAPPFVRKEALPPDSRPEELLARHRTRLDALLASGPPPSFDMATTLDGVIAYSRRHSRQLSEHRQALGLLTEAELMSMVASGQEATGQRVWQEFLALREKRERSA